MQFQICDCQSCRHSRHESLSCDSVICRNAAIPNKRAPIVQEPINMKSVKATSKEARAAKAAKARPKTDRRILRTRNALGDALVALIQEKNFDEITVQDVLDRAQVGRSTFYVHYRDKQDLFLSDVEDFLASFSTALNRQGASPKRLLPVKEFFAHIREARDFYSAVVSSGKMNDVQALA